MRLDATPEESVRGLRGLAMAFPDITILGVRRGTPFYGAPPTDIDLHEGDELIIYSHRDHELVS